MNKKNLWKVIWIVSIYALLISILYLVILYKTKWEGKDLNTYLYFYDCGETVCTSTTRQNKIYNKIKCEDKICPSIKDMHDDIVILSNSEKEWIYNYKKNAILSNKYNNYKYINNNNYIVKNNTGRYGIISLTANGEEEMVVEDNYSKIIDYKNDYLLYVEDNKYNIVNVPKDKNINLDDNYKNIGLINDKYYYYLKDDKYLINDYNTNKATNSETYNYIYSYGGVVIVVNNRAIDILNADDLKSTLLMKIPTFFEYKSSQEIKSLNIKVNKDILYFNVILEDKKYQSYRYDLKNKKIL